MKTQIFSQVAKNVGLSLIVYLVARIGLTYILSWGRIWDGVLFFNFVELVLFFAISFVALVLINQRWPNLGAERIYLRLVIAITTTVVLAALVSSMSRDFPQYLLSAYAFCMVVWAMFGRLITVSLTCLLLIIGLLLSPIDVRVSFHSDDFTDHGVFVKLLEANYGLIDQPEPGTYPMGCVIPPYPVRWILRIGIQ